MVARSFQGIIPPLVAMMVPHQEWEEVRHTYPPLGGEWRPSTPQMVGEEGRDTYPPLGGEWPLLTPLMVGEEGRYGSPPMG